MILFKEKRPATLEDIRWLRKSLGRRLEDSCLRAIDPKLYSPRLTLSLIDSVVLAVTEIANNVIQHSRPKAASLSLEVQLIGSGLRVEICDDGGGFETFGEAFQRASRIRHGEGLIQGRGLSLVSQSLQEIEYHPGKPNRFVGWRKLRTIRPNILIVEQDEEELRNLKTMLSQTFRCLFARGLTEAQNLLASQRVDVILANYYFGGRGENVFKADADKSPIPVVLMASPNEFDKLRRQPSPYVDHCLQKPISTSALIAAIEVAIASYVRRLVHLANHFGRSGGLLLPNELPTELPGYGLAVLAGTAAYGGGDFALALPGKRSTRLVLADIMGHGLKAKAAAIALAAIVRTLHCRRHILADTLLKNVSHIVRNEPAFTDIICTLIAVDAAADGWVEAASAGHPPIAIVSPKRSFVLPVTGPLPGLLAMPNYQTKSCRLEPGDKIAIVTDGIDFQTSATAEFPGQLMTELGKYKARPLSSMENDVERWLTGKLGPAPKDDWTLLIAEFRGNPDDRQCRRQQPSINLSS
jgi:anti-sigma regulatory factor (Ser/Thr protein kinase)/CheY-like chemotaxis protein